MPSGEIMRGADQNTELALAVSIWTRINNHLEDQRRRIYEEIKNYPRPIPACDLQFNQLLESRAGLLQEIARMHDACQERPGGGASLNVLRDFVRTSSYLDLETTEGVNAAVEGRDLQ